MSQCLFRFLHPGPIVALSLAAFAAPAAFAADASGWTNDTYSKMRLIGGATASGAAALRAGLELELAPGWKTYWRYPGDSGVPPRFNFSGSTNVKDVTVLWPAPERFSDGAGFSIGYHGRLVLPLRVTPRDPSKPAVLRADVHYAVCERLCVPAEGKAQLTLDGAAGSHDALLAAAEARVPKPAALDAPGPLAVTAIRRAESATHPRIVVEVRAPADAKLDLFAEGPTPNWALPLPEPQPRAAAAGPDGASSRRAFSFELDGLPAGADIDGAILTLTLVGPERAIEVKTRLD